MPAFNGFQCGGDDFDHREAKRILGLAMDKLRNRSDLRRKIGIAPRSPDKKDVHDNGASVWGVLAFKSAPISEKNPPHLTLGVGREYVSAMVTLPNSAPARYRRALIGRGEPGFRCVMGKVLGDMPDCPGMEPRLRIWQRRYLSRPSPPLIDAAIDVDLRTLDGDRASRVKPQPEWVGAAFDVLENKNSNLELQIGAKFPYRTCPVIAEPHVLNFVAKAWIACNPYIDVLFGAEDAPAP